MSLSAHTLPAKDLFGSNNLDYLRSKPEPEFPAPCTDDIPIFHENKRRKLAQYAEQKPYGGPPDPSQNNRYARAPPPANTQNDKDSYQHNWRNRTMPDNNSETKQFDSNVYEFPSFTLDRHSHQQLKQKLLSIIFPDQPYRGRMDKLPGPQPMTFSRRHLALLKGQKFLVAEKSDGVRAILFITEHDAYLVDRMFTFRRIECPFYAKNFGKPGVETVLDGELVDCKGTECSHELVYLAYDAVMVDGRYCGKQRLSERLAHIRDTIALPYWERRSDEEHPFALKAKFFVEISQIDAVWRLINENSRTGEYEYRRKGSRDIQMNKNDGLIFTADGDDFMMSKNRYHLLKWKYPELNSIDLKVIAPFFTPEQELKLYCVGPGSSNILIRKVPLTIKYREMLDELVEGKDSLVIEFAYAPHEIGEDENGMPMDCSWVPLRSRPDKNTANYITTVTATLETLVEDITYEELKQTCVQKRHTPRPGSSTGYQPRPGSSSGYNPAAPYSHSRPSSSEGHHPQSHTPEHHTSQHSNQHSSQHSPHEKRMSDSHEQSTNKETEYYTPDQRSPKSQAHSYYE